MHTIYRLYCVLCSMHFAVGVLVLSLGFQPQTFVLVAGNMSDAAGGWMRALPMHTPLSSVYFLASMFSSVFSMAYLTLMDNSNNNMNENSKAASEVEYSQQELLIDLVFWCFLAAETYVALGCTTQAIQPIEQLYLRFVLRMGASYIICSPLEKKRGPQLASSFAFVVFLGMSIVDMMLVRTEPILVVFYLHRFLELLLMMGHRWDQEPSIEVLQNCRLCYVSLAGLLLHVDMILAAR